MLQWFKFTLNINKTPTIAREQHWALANYVSFRKTYINILQKLSDWPARVKVWPMLRAILFVLNACNSSTYSFCLFL